MTKLLGVIAIAAVAFAVNEHGEFAGEVVIGADGELASGAPKLLLLGIELQHEQTPVQTRDERRSCRVGKTQS